MCEETRILFSFPQQRPGAKSGSAVPALPGVSTFSNSSSWKQALPGCVPSVVTRTTLVCLPAAFTRLLPNSGQPLYGWLAKSVNLRPARFSGLEGPISTLIHFIWNHLPSWPKPEEKPVRNGLEVYHCPIDKPAVKRLAFNLEASRVNAALGQSLLPPSQIPICAADNFDSRSFSAPQM